MLMGQKTRTFVVLSQKTVLIRKVSRAPPNEEQGEDARFRAIICTLMMGEPDRHSRETTARDGMARNHQQYILVAEGPRTPTLRRLLLEELAHSFRKDVRRWWLVVGMVVGERDGFPVKKLLCIIRLLLFAFYQLSSASTGIKHEQVATPQINAAPLALKYTSVIGNVEDQKVIYLSRTCNRLVGVRGAPPEAWD